ncbi:MAG: hypothetical protein AMS14_10640, partial [Planctomycetes bacterium DG_20]
VNARARGSFAATASPVSAKSLRPRGVGGVSPASSHRRLVAQRSSPRYGRGAARKTVAPASAAATAASTPAVEPPTTTTSTSQATGIRRADSVTTAAPATPHAHTPASTAAATIESTDPFMACTFPVRDVHAEYNPPGA